MTAAHRIDTAGTNLSDWEKHHFSGAFLVGGTTGRENRIMVDAIVQALDAADLAGLENKDQAAAYQALEGMAKFGHKGLPMDPQAVATQLNKLVPSLQRRGIPGLARAPRYTPPWTRWRRRRNPCWGPGANRLAAPRRNPAPRRASPRRGPAHKSFRCRGPRGLAHLGRPAPPQRGTNTSRWTSRVETRSNRPPANSTTACAAFLAGLRPGRGRPGGVGPADSGGPVFPYRA